MFFYFTFRKYRLYDFKGEIAIHLMTRGSLDRDEDDFFSVPADVVEAVRVGDGISKGQGPK